MPDGNPKPARIDGHCDARFAAVREAFVGNFRDHDELGAALHIRVDGRDVVDLWGGHREAARRSPWERETLVNVYSVGKGLLAILTLTLVERGVLELDSPIALLWPEFGAAGKEQVTLRTLLAHRGGLPAVRKRLPEGAMFDWCLMCRALAEQEPYWEPGTDHGYHCNTWGFLVGELIRRATGRDVGAALQQWITGPLSADYFCGLPRRHHGRVAELVAPSAVLTDRDQWAQAFPPTGDEEHDTMIWHTYFNPSGLSGAGVVNTEAWRLAQIPSTNGHGTARAVAAVYDALLRGGAGAEAWVGPGLLAEATRIHSDGDDLVLGRPSRFGLGFQLAQPTRPLGPNPEAFGHFGYGGSLGFADPTARVAFAHLTNRPGKRWQTTRTQRLVDALYAGLDSTSRTLSTSCAES
jgi:CubicO group peptidase (beta-lactamase class C family)